VRNVELRACVASLQFLDQVWTYLACSHHRSSGFRVYAVVERCPIFCFFSTWVLSGLLLTVWPESDLFSLLKRASSSLSRLLLVLPLFPFFLAGGGER
jgi:hypothetical protein